MSISDINAVMQNALLLGLKIAAPFLVVVVVIGLFVSILQAATQIHEQTLSFVPKLIAIALILLILGPWIMESMNDFTKYIFDLVASLD